MLNDIRYAFRMIANHRLFSIAVIATMALGIGVNTTVFTLVNSVLFKPVPVPNGERLVAISGHNLNQADSRFSVSYPDFRDFHDQNDSFDQLEAVRNRSATISEATNPPERYSGAHVTTGLFDMLKTQPMMGRGFWPEDGLPDAAKVLLISHNVWQNRYAGAREVVGREVRLDGRPATIVGVMPEGFQFPSNQNVWTPIIETSEAEDRSRRILNVFGMLKEDVELASAGADLATIAHRIASDYPDDNKDISVMALTFHEHYNGGTIRNVFLVMLGAVGFVLLIACSNVANMMLSRAISRRHEISVRTSLGAARWQLIRQLLIESVALSILGGLLGLGLALFGIHAFDQATQNVGKPYWIVFEMDYRVFAYFAVICVLSGIVFGLTPALRATRMDVVTTLKDSGRGTSSHRGGKLTSALVVFQFALTTILLSGAGLMVRSYFVAQSINEFVPTENIFTVRVNLPGGKGKPYSETSARLNFHESLFERIRTIPGVVAVAGASNLPGLGASSRRVEIDGRPEEIASEAPRASFVVRTKDYHSTIGLSLIRGEDFGDFIQEEGDQVAIATNEFAQHFWPGESAIGKRFRFFEDGEAGSWATVIGVSGDLDQDPSDRDFEPVVFLPHQQRSASGLTIAIRTTGDAAALARPVRRMVQELDQDLPLFEARTLQEAINGQFWFLKTFGTLFLSFAMIGLVIAAVGIYGVIAQSTAQRTQEIGIRMALGASARRILKRVLARGLIQMAIGLGLGLIGAFAANTLMSELTLASVSPHDPLVFIVIGTIIVLVGLLACWAPARRAALLEPSTALRHD